MAYKYEHLIPQNIAPRGATSIGIYDSNGRRIGGLSLGRLKPPTESKLYSFMALSDPHIPSEGDDGNRYGTGVPDLQRALTYAEISDCAFTCICGDLTAAGTNDQLARYKSVVEEYAKTKPVYAMGGNHETARATGLGNMTFDRLTPYTGKPMYYSFEQGNDVFIMLSHYGQEQSNGSWLSSEFVSVEELQWLYATLEANRNKRCFVFNHCFPYDDRVGDANRLYGAQNWRTQDGSIGEAFINLLKHYKNTILFHGHSHLRLKLQERDKMANYSSEVGYRSVHIPSVAVPKDYTGTSDLYVVEESEGYVVDVYENFIVLNGRDFIDNDANGHGIGIATYKIDTTLQIIAPNTFTDNTGIINT